MATGIQITWYVDDGYVNPGPQSFRVDFTDFDFVDGENIKEELLDWVQEDFAQNVGPYVPDLDNYVEQIKKARNDREN